MTDELYYFVSTLFRKQFELFVIDKAKRKIKKGKYHVFVVGHSHGDKIHKTKHGKYILNTGSWRDEYKYLAKDQTYYPKDKNYGYILHDDKKIHDIKILRVKSKQKPIKLNVIKKIIESYKRDISYFFK